MTRVTPLTWFALVLAILTVCKLAAWLMAPETLYDYGNVDTWLRLEIISDLYHGGGWYDHWIARTNAPYGIETPWTRPLDVLMLALTLPFLLFLPFDQALTFAAFLLNPLVLLGCLALVLRITRCFSDQMSVRLFASGVFLIYPMTIGAFRIGVVDHHTLLCLLMLALVWLATSGEMRSRWMGVLAGLGIWISVEFQVVVALLLVWLAWMWILSGERRWLKGAVHMLMTASTVVVLAILLERLPVQYPVFFYDSVSVMQLMTLIAALVGFMGLKIASPRIVEMPQRLLMAGLTGLGVLAILSFFFPGILQGPLAGVDPTMKEIFLSGIQEMQPAYHHGVDFALALVVMVVLAGCGLWCLRQQMGRSDAQLWLLLILTLAFLVLTLAAVRFGSYLAPLQALLMAWVLARWPVRPVAMAMLAVAPYYFLIASAMLAPDAPDEAAPCLRQMARVIEKQPLNAGSEVLTVAAPPNMGTYLIYRTPHRIIASNYHRNLSGYLDLKTVLDGQDHQKVLAILKERKVGMVMVCDVDRASQGLAAYLNNKHPDWAVRQDAWSDTALGLSVYRLNLSEIN